MAANRTSHKILLAIRTSLSRCYLREFNRLSKQYWLWLLPLVTSQIYNWRPHCGRHHVLCTQDSEVPGSIRPKSMRTSLKVLCTLPKKNNQQPYPAVMLINFNNDQHCEVICEYSSGIYVMIITLIVPKTIKEKQWLLLET